MNTLIGLIVGATAGLHVAAWGMYKDAPHEGFTIPRFGRSIIVGGVMGMLLVPIPGSTLPSAGGLLVLFGLAYVAERAVTEFWKTFIRTEDQTKYFIPMQFHILGRVVHSRAARIAAGAAAVAVGLCFVAAADAFLAAWRHVPRVLLVATVGSLGGWYSAFGGASKDAPIEGFEILKFFRSPVVASLWALVLSPFEPDPIVIAFAALGFTIATLETYKTFFFPSKPRGKFAGRPISHPDMLVLRNRLVPVYATIWAALLITFVAAYAYDLPFAAGPGARLSFAEPAGQAADSISLASVSKSE